MKVVYLDNNATTRTAPEVVEAMLPYFSTSYGNPSSMHTLGGQVAKAIQQAREEVAALIGADPQEIVYTSCGTESDNAAIWGTLNSYPKKNHIISTRVEHPAVGNLVSFLSKKGYLVTVLPVDREGRLDLEQLASAITDQTALVSIMWANNETGVIFPLEEIAQLVKSRGVVLHTDAVQAVGKLPLDLKSIPIDLLSFSGHKLHAPKGIGVLYIRKGTRFTPFIIGGHQERGRRGGTENVPYIIGLGQACGLAQKNLGSENERVKALRDKLEQGIMDTIPRVLINGTRQERLPNTVSVSFEYVEGESILLLLSNLGICASSGSACTSGSLEPSHVLRAMGVPFTAAHGSIRFSLSVYNTEEEIDFVLEHLPPIIERLRAISPFWKQGTAPIAAACQ
jgi:cysteine desulfurase